MTLLAVRHSSQLLGMLNKIKSDCEMLSTNLQKYDKEVSNIYHEIELSVLNEKDALEISTRLQHVLKLRRKAKYELSQLNILLKQTGSENFKIKVKNTKESILYEEKAYIKNYPLYKQIINTDYHKLNREGVTVN